MTRVMLLADALVTLALPASALAVTPASFDITGGALSISAPAGANVDLGSRLATGHPSALAR